MHHLHHLRKEVPSFQLSEDDRYKDWSIVLEGLVCGDDHVDSGKRTHTIQQFKTLFGSSSLPCIRYYISQGPLFAVITKNDAPQVIVCRMVDSFDTQRGRTVKCSTFNHRNVPLRASYHGSFENYVETCGLDSTSCFSFKFFSSSALGSSGKKKEHSFHLDLHPHIPVDAHHFVPSSPTPRGEWACTLVLDSETHPGHLRADSQLRTGVVSDLNELSCDYLECLSAAKVTKLVVTEMMYLDTSHLTMVLESIPTLKELVGPAKMPVDLEVLEAAQERQVTISTFSDSNPHEVVFGSMQSVGFAKQAIGELPPIATTQSEITGVNDIFLHLGTGECLPLKAGSEAQSRLLQELLMEEEKVGPPEQQQLRIPVSPSPPVETKIWQLAVKFMELCTNSSSSSNDDDNIEGGEEMDLAGIFEEAMNTAPWKEGETPQLWNYEFSLFLIAYIAPLTQKERISTLCQLVGVGWYLNVPPLKYFAHWALGFAVHGTTEPRKSK